MKRMALTAATLLLLSGCAVLSAEAEVVPRETHAPILEVSFSVAGDSITATHDRITGEPRGELSWVNWATTPKVLYAGGYAESGNMTSQLCAAFTPTPADVLVIMAGTNDVNNRIDAATSTTYVDCIATTSALPPAHIIVSAIAPTDRWPTEAIAYNTTLAAYAAARGWVFVDPWVAFRNADGTWVVGSAYDELHPNGATQSVVGATLRNQIIAINDK